MIINVRQSSASGKVLTVQTTSNATVTLRKNDRVEEQTADGSGVLIFKGLSSGVWSVTATKGPSSKTKEVDIQENISIEIYVSSVPEFTYTTSYEDGGYVVCDDNDVDITNKIDTHQGDWKIKFLKSGILSITCLNEASSGIDVFCVGGGGNGVDGPIYTHEQSGGSGVGAGTGGGGGGYTTTKRGVSVPTGTYDISVGGSGGTTYAFKGKSFEVSAANGKTGGHNGYDGGDGGSGGGAGSWTTNTCCSGGTNGNNGYTVPGDNYTHYGYAGKGQGNPPGTREFGESNGKLYSTGGTGGSNYWAPPRSVTPNTGDGGHGGGGANARITAAERKGVKGASGIVIIRNKRT